MRDVLDFDEIDQSHLPLIGGKAANLARLRHIPDVRVPDGFCVTTGAFRRVVDGTPEVGRLLDQLARLETDDRAAIATLSAQLCDAIDGLAVPDDLRAAIGAATGRLGDTACAVRSSATAEDLPSASFAGQQDSYLNVVGRVAVVEHVRRCWASLFTERAVTYRLRNGFDHGSVRMAVVVQRMVFAQAAGILFTADPVTSDRTVTCLAAGLGLGEAMVAGTADTDAYTIRGDEIVTRAIAVKPTAVRAASFGGTCESPIEPDEQRRPALTDAQIVRLARRGRRIEAHFGCPQDIEWCLVDDDVQIVQSRPITTLFPVPETDDDDDDGDGAKHVYVSVGHQQMMTDPMKPLGLSFWQLTTPRPMHEAGGRLFVDVEPMLTTPAGRAAIMDNLGRSDPLIGDALQTLLERGDVIRSLPDGAGPPVRDASAPPDADPGIVRGLIERVRTSVATLEREIGTLSGPALCEFIRADLAELKRVLFAADSHEVIMAGMRALWWLNEHLETWLGERNAADPLIQSVPDNITSQMGLALLDLADLLRPFPDVVTFLAGVERTEIGAEDFLDALATRDGGGQACDAIRNYLAEYGMRCAGEIDITRPRWSEQPAALVPLILGNIANFESGAAARRFEQGLHQALATEQQLLERVRALPDGDRKADDAKRMIDRVRVFTGYREWPKYGMVRRYFAYKQALLREARRLVAAGTLRAEDDIYYLRFAELCDVVRSHEVDHDLIRRRREAFRSYAALTPPRVMTSDGEVVAGTYRRDDLPPGALAGLAVSAGTIEGRARVVTTMSEADIDAGDILVTAYTDPSWTPLFVAVAGLVTEVGGLMTHGAVIAREYGLPAVVGVEGATRLIRDGQRIRVHGTEGYVQLLS